jgi:hypothetical protein
MKKARETLFAVKVADFFFLVFSVSICDFVERKKETRSSDESTRLLSGSISRICLSFPLTIGNHKKKKLYRTSHPFSHESKCRKTSLQV